MEQLKKKCFDSKVFERESLKRVFINLAMSAKRVKKRCSVGADIVMLESFQSGQ